MALKGNNHGMMLALLVQMLNDQKGNVYGICLSLYVNLRIPRAHVHKKMDIKEVWEDVSKSFCHLSVMYT